MTAVGIVIGALRGIGAACAARRPPRPVDTEVASGCIDFADILGSEFDRCCANVLFERCRLRVPGIGTIYAF
jgi:hypothetical protein